MCYTKIIIEMLGKRRERLMAPRRKKKSGIAQVVRLPLTYHGDRSAPPYTDMLKIMGCVYLAKNFAIQTYWEWEHMPEAFRAEHPEVFQKQVRSEDGAVDSYIYHQCTDKFPNWHTGNLNSSLQQVRSAYKEAAFDVLNGRKSVASYNGNAPMEIKYDPKWKSIKLLKGKNTYTVRFPVFSSKYGGETQMEFEVSHPKKYLQAILERCMMAEEDGGYELGEGKLLYNRRQKKLFLNLTYYVPKVKTEDEQMLDPKKILGVDLGIAKVAYWGILNSKSSGYIPGGKIDHFRRQMEARKKELQEGGKFCGPGRIGHGYKTRNKPVLNLRDKIARFRNTENDTYSRIIVDFALKEHCGTIQMEDLSSIGKKEKDQKYLRDWTYGDLQRKIEAKATRVGIKVNYVNPSNTSRRCSVCGYIDQSNRPSQAEFRCLNPKCEKYMEEINADYNASLNLATEGIAEIIANYDPSEYVVPSKGHEDSRHRRG